MIKIIRHGINHLGSTRFECDRCGCIFETDEYRARIASNRGEYDMVFSKCPECNHIISKVWS